MSKNKKRVVWLPLSMDLQPRRVRRDPLTRQQQTLGEIRKSADIIASLATVTRGMIGRDVTVTTTPTLIIQAQFVRSYLITNPTPTMGLTTSGTLLASSLRTASSSGNTQSVPVGVSSYKEVKLFLDISASGGGLVTIDAQSKDPLSGNWATTQSDIFGTPASVGTYYADLGTLGVDQQFAVSWSVDATGSSTFSLGYLLKDGLPGSGTGLNNTVYIGAEGVTTASGFPLLEGKEKSLHLLPNVELWAVSELDSGVTLRVFEL